MFSMHRLSGCCGFDIYSLDERCQEFLMAWEFELAQGLLTNQLQFRGQSFAPALEAGKKNVGSG